MARKFEIDGSLSRWMCFIDGENLAIRGQAFARDNGLILTEGENFRQNIFLWIPDARPLDIILHGRAYGSNSRPIRSYYYTSAVGDEAALNEIRESLWATGFHPEVFKKSRQDQKAKGVDIALAKDFLGNAFRHNYDVAFLFAGDGDYVPLVEEVKRVGKVVCVVFFSSQGLSPSLKIAADHFLCIEDSFRYGWRARDNEP